MTETAAEAARILRQHIADSRGRERITVTAARLTTVLDAVENSGHTAPAPRRGPMARGSAEYAAAEAAFTDYFVRNYPGPDTIIFNPNWHAPKLFAAAVAAIRPALACMKDSAE